MTRRDALRVLGLTAAAVGLRGAPRPPPRPTGEVKIGLAAEPNTFDPHLTVGRNSQIFIANVYDGLTARDGQGNLVPALAESWKRLNPTTWQFTLRKGVKFHNGDEFNADSVKFTLDRATNPETKATISSELSTIAGDRDREPLHRQRDHQDARLPAAGAPGRAVRADALAQAHQRHGQGGHRHQAERDRPVQAGRRGRRTSGWCSRRTTSYWRGAPKVKTIVVRPILEDAARIAALQTGEVDLIAPVPHVRIAELQRNDKLVIKTIAAPRIFHVTIDVRKPPFDNVKVRQALNHAVDVNAILKTLYFGHGTRLATVVDKGALGYDPSVQPYPYDPNKAKALLAEAGFPNGFEVEFDSFTGSIADHSKPAEAIVGYLQKVGIKAKLNVFEFSAFGPRRVQNKTAPLFIYSIGNAYLEPSWVIRWMTQGGLGMHYKNAKLDEMLTRIEATDDPKKRAPQYSDVQKLIKDEAPFIFLYQADAAFGMSARVDYTPRPDETQWLYPTEAERLSAS